MSFNRKYLVLAVALLASGCGGGGGSGDYGSGGMGSGGNDTPPPAPPPPPMATAFTPFVKEQLAQTSDTSEPANVNDQQWEFDENEAAFDDVLQ